MSDDEIREPRVGWAGKLGSEGEGSRANGEDEEIWAAATGLALGKFGSTLRGFFQALLRLLVLMCPPAPPLAEDEGGSEGGLTAETEPPTWTRPAITLPELAEIDARARCPLARELTAAITFCASGPS